jgi:hypothetical protein
MLVKLEFLFAMITPLVKTFPPAEWVHHQVVMFSAGDALKPVMFDW